MAEEFNALLRNGTWDLVPRSHDMNIVGCKGIYQVKRKANGSLERFKAKLVARGLHQQDG